MTREKIAVSLPPELVAQAQRAVAEGRAASVSAYVALALQNQAINDDLPHEVRPRPRHQHDPHGCEPYR